MIDCELLITLTVISHFVRQESLEIPRILKSRMKGWICGKGQGENIIAGMSCSVAWRDSVIPDVPFRHERHFVIEALEARENKNNRWDT